jgi:hypothetical protein
MLRYEQKIFFQAMVGRPQVAQRIGGCSTDLLLRGCCLGNSFIDPIKNGLNFNPDLRIHRISFPPMNETLIYTDTRPRAKSTGHAFGFEGNLGMPVIISGMLSVLILTLLLNGENGMPLFVKFLVASLPTSLTILYIVALRSRRPPRFDLDLFASWVNGRSFQPVRVQPRHPFIPNR